MKIANDLFFKARKDPDLNGFLVVQGQLPTDAGGTQVRTFMRLCINEKSKYSDTNMTNVIDADTEIQIQNYSGYDNTSRREVNTIVFHCWANTHNSHIRTFLNAIKKESNICFRVVAFNSNDTTREKRLVSHQLYGFIDHNCFFLNSYTGEDNSASPVA